MFTDSRSRFMAPNHRALVGFTLALVVACALPAWAAEPNTLSEEEISQGWILLFDGRTTFGWEPTSKANWKVADGSIKVSSGEPGLLCTTSEFDNYSLKFDFRASPTTNSGVFLRTPLKPTDPGKDCYELNIAAPDVSPYPTGSLVSRGKVEAECDLTQWHTLQAILEGPNVTIWLDGKRVLNYAGTKELNNGHIGLQLNKGPVEFRNIKLLPLDLEELLNGKDLSGWRIFPDKRSQFAVTPEGVLTIKNGDGQLESEREFADFILQVDVKTNGRGLNSGIFFRNIPGKFWQGYESQIHNAYRNGNREDPFDFGTGGFYRRQKARRVVADDKTWFTKTLVVNGPHMACWVNGYQVSDWTDTRDPNDNPREGLRLAPGTLAIQGHDTTTNLEFRHLRVSEMAKN